MLRLSLLVLGVVAAATIAAPLPSSAAPCTAGNSELWGNDLAVSQAEADTRIGLGLSFYTTGPTLYALWNDPGASPIPHSAKDYKWIFDAGLLMHEIGHNLQMCHGGPVITSDNREVLFVTSDNGRLYKLDAQTGAVLANVDTRLPTCASDRVNATPAVQLFNFSNPSFQSAVLAERGTPDDLVYVATATGCGDATHNRIYAFWASTLTPKWQFNATGVYSMGDARDGCEVDYGSNAVYCGTEQLMPGQSTLWAVQSLTGSLLWSYNAGSIQNRPRVKPGSPSTELYLSSIDGTLQKRNPADGSLIWSQPGTAFIRSPWPEFRAPLPTRIFYTTTDGLLHGTLDNFPAPVPLWPPISPGGGVTFTTAPAVASGLGQLYLGRSDGKIQEVSLAGVPGLTATGGAPSTVFDPALDVDALGVTDFDRLLVTTTEGKIKRFCVPWGSATGVADSPPVTEALLSQNAPNPFGSNTRIEYRLPYDARVEVDVFDVDGHRVRTLARESQPAGPHEVAWNGLDDAGRSVSSGFYFYRLRAVGPEGRSFERAKKIQVVH